MTEAKAVPIDASDFTLTGCGPLDKLQARLGIPTADSTRLIVRAIATALFAWLPLLIMTLFARSEGTPTVTFFQDIASYVRFLVVIPLLILAEATVGHRTRMVASGFATSGLIGEEDAPRFVAAVRSARKMSESFVAEVVIAILAFVVIWLGVENLMRDGVLFWYEEERNGAHHLSMAGWWYAFVASPIAFFLFLRWAWRYFVWSWFLRKVSKLNLRVIGTHPDRAGGLGFITVGHDAFAVCAFAASAVVAAAAANRVLYEGIQLKSYQTAMAGFVVVSVVLALVPLLTFMRPLLIVKRKGIIKYGDLGGRYVREFEQKWIEGKGAPGEPLLGTGDIQSLADIGGSYERLDKMSVVPFDRRTVLAFAAAAAIPMIPLLLTVISLRELMQLFVKAMM